MAPSTDPITRIPERGSTGSERVSYSSVAASVPTRLGPSFTSKSIGTMPPPGGGSCRKRNPEGGSVAFTTSSRKSSEPRRECASVRVTPTTPPARRVRTATNCPGSESPSSPVTR